MIKIFPNFSSTFTKFLSSTTSIRASFCSSVKLPMVCRRCSSVFHRIVATTFGCVDNSAAENRGIFSAQFAFSSLFRSSFSDVSAVNIRIRFALLSLQKPSEYWTSEYQTLWVSGILMAKSRDLANHLNTNVNRLFQSALQTTSLLLAITI